MLVKILPLLLLLKILLKEETELDKLYKQQLIETLNNYKLFSLPPKEHQ